MTNVRPSTPPESVGYSDGLEGDELINNVLSVFGVDLRDDTDEIATVGDLERRISEETGLEGDEVCLVARSFRRIRDVFAKQGVTVSPSTRLDDLLDGKSASAWSDDLSDLTGLELDLTEYKTEASVSITIFSMLAVGSFIYAYFAHSTWPPVWQPVFCFFVIAGLSKMPRRFPADVKTVGDLVRKTLRRNYTRLKAIDDRGTSADLWLALTQVVRDINGTEGPLRRDMTFY